jgi:hypothetical protein
VDLHNSYPLSSKVTPAPEDYHAKEAQRVGELKTVASSLSASRVSEFSVSVLVNYLSAAVGSPSASRGVDMPGKTRILCVATK